MSIDELKSSGLLELYVIGDVTESEKIIVNKAIADFPSLKQEVSEIEKALEAYAQYHAKPVCATTKPMLLATLDYTERINKGEQSISLPSLGPTSKISDFSKWLERPDFQEPQEYGDMHGKIISADDQRTTMVVWLKYGAPDEIHSDELEKFLVLEGTCDIIIGDHKHSLTAGDYLSIPLHIKHRVEVTSDSACKVILERAAA